MENKYDIYEPNPGHFKRFKDRLNTDYQKAKNKKIRYSKWYLVAASVALLVSLWYNFKEPGGYELADISPEMQETQNYFVSVINAEVKKIDLQKNDDNEQMIAHALQRVTNLEFEYKKLTIELKETGFDKHIINAMIFNFQQRIEVLQNLMEQINNHKRIKNEIKSENYV